MTFIERFRQFVIEYNAQYNDLGHTSVEQECMIIKSVSLGLRYNRIVSRFGPETRIASLWPDWKSWVLRP